MYNYQNTGNKSNFPKNPVQGRAHTKQTGNRNATAAST